MASGSSSSWPAFLPIPGLQLRPRRPVPGSVPVDESIDERVTRRGQSLTQSPSPGTILWAMRNLPSFFLPEKKKNHGQNLMSRATAANPRTRVRERDQSKSRRRKRAGARAEGRGGTCRAARAGDEGIDWGRGAKPREVRAGAARSGILSLFFFFLTWRRRARFFPAAPTSNHEPHATERRQRDGVGGPRF